MIFLLTQAVGLQIFLNPNLYQFIFDSLFTICNLILTFFRYFTIDIFLTLIGVIQILTFVKNTAIKDKTTTNPFTFSLYRSLTIFVFLNYLKKQTTSFFNSVIKSSFIQRTHIYFLLITKKSLQDLESSLLASKYSP